MTRLNALRRDQRGVTAIEFAMISLPMLTLIMGSIEFGLNIFAKANLDGTLKVAARMATTGDATLVGNDGAAIDQYVRDRVTLVKGTTVTIDKQFYDKFDQVRQPEKKLSGDAPPYCFADVNGNQRWDLDPGRSGLGGADDIINYRVSLSYPVLFPLITKLVTGENRMSIVSEVSLKNEPFAGGNDVKVKTCCVSAAVGNPVTCT